MSSHRVDSYITVAHYIRKSFVIVPLIMFFVSLVLSGIMARKLDLDTLDYPFTQIPIWIRIQLILPWAIYAAMTLVLAILYFAAVHFISCGELMIIAMIIPIASFVMSIVSANLGHKAFDMLDQQAIEDLWRIFQAREIAFANCVVVGVASLIIFPVSVYHFIAYKELRNPIRPLFCCC